MKRALRALVLVVGLLSTVTGLVLPTIVVAEDGAPMPTGPKVNK